MREKLLALWIEQAKRATKTLKERQGQESTFTTDTVYWDQVATEMRALLAPWLADLARQGVTIGLTHIFGARIAGKLAKQEPITVGPDWELVNLVAEEWARRYSYDLVSGINDATRQRLQAAIAEWIAAGEAFPALATRIEAIFNNPVRAEMIAATEATRAFAEGNVAAWKASGLVEYREWRTAVDERVCPICNALHKQRAKIGELFRVTVNGKDYGIENPPAHVRCRCWAIPVIEVKAVMKASIAYARAD